MFSVQTVIPILCLTSCIGVFSIEISKNFYDENEHFCIQTQPILFDDFKESANSRSAANCKMIAKTLTAEEKDQFQKIMCQDLQKTRNIDHYYYFRLRNGELTGRGVHNDICLGKLNPYLAWLPLKVLQRTFLPEFNPTEHLNYIGKTASGESTVELCHFQHADLVANSTSKLLKCLSLEHQEISFPLNDHIDVLIEVKPLFYEIRNITYLPWSNMSTSYKAMLGRSKLNNKNAKTKQIYGALTYSYVEKVKLNLSSIYGDKLERLPILMEHNEAFLELDRSGNGSIEVKEKAYFGRVLSPFSEIKVNIIGQWSELSKQFSADVYEYFGQGINRFREQIEHGLVKLVRITSTEPAFELHETMDKQIAYKYEQEKSFSRLNIDEDELKDDSNDEVTDVDVTSTGHPYPYFYMYTIIGCLIVGTAFLLAIGGMVKTCSKEKESKQKKNYKLTSTAIH